ncbi:MaoC family dehydratase [Alsobacter sp. SYSU M60028]|uniref:MaoC family dehydratase n=1 Tax=Alsobacter ponti TaxID=2962936 RepID=A0ABT1L6S2_9HYPH|nr:MaoC family dehydratase [Alsobacter ponti]MCP8937014.1 MaoC family dehydratase [Alsobacter ponti]
MSGFYEELEIGDTAELGAHLFTADEIKAFAASYDPQAFHLDEEAGRRSHFGALCASGWHTAAVWMSKMVEHRKRIEAEREAAGLPPVRLGPSPGFRDLRWLRPVRAGDTVTFRSTVTAKRPVASRPGWGLVSHHNTGVNQVGERVFEFNGSVFWPMKPAD